uniref:Uncharacterized protein n=1 Tax=Ananas comosus var. bracteatus TaxID=296719 RepID=A0A6V7NXZ2_ANACO|nr:unnamed protein product [Ananas comosus var. bracteatus]
METPQCVVTPAAEGTYLAYIDLSIPRNESIVEMVRCWGAQSSTSATSKQDAACLTIKRMVEEFDLQVKNVSEFGTERIKICHAIEEYHGVINRLISVPQ